VGRPPYQAALRLCAIAQDRWAEFDAAYLPVDLIALPFDRFLNAIYALCVKHLDEQKKESFDLQLNAPLEGMGVKAQRWTAEQEAEDFMNLLNGG
jgi:hypothetical protein